MARIAGVDLPPKKRAEIGLTYIYGIGRSRSRSLLYRAGIEFDKKVGDLSEDEVNRVRQILEEEGAVEGDLRKEVSMNIKRHIEMGSYRGLRHRRGLPVRGSIDQLIPFRSSSETVSPLSGAVAREAGWIEAHLTWSEPGP